MRAVSQHILAMGKAGLAAILLLGINSPIVIAKPKKDAIAAYKKAQDFRKKYDIRAARTEYLSAIEMDNQWADPHIALAEVSLELMDPLTAKIEAERAVKLGADPARVNHILAHSLWLTGKGDKAKDILQNGEFEDANLPYAQRILARIYLDEGDTDAAQKSLEEGLKLAPKDSMLWTEIGRVRIAYANQGAAIEALDYAVKLDPNNIRALELRGRLMRSQFGLVAALPWFERGLQINPSDIALMEEYAATLGDAGRNRDMLTMARKIIAINKNNPRAYYMQAVIAARAGDYELAKRIMPKLGSQYIDVPGARLLYGIIEFELGNLNQAAEHFELLLDAQPNNISARTLLARVHYKAGSHQEAWDILAPIADRSDADRYTLILAARILEALNKPKDAFVKLDNAVAANIIQPTALPEKTSMLNAADAVKRAPNDARKVVPYVRLLMAQGNIAAAKAEINRIAQGNNGVADAQILLGDVERASGNYNGAIAAYGRARNVNFSTPVMLRLVATYRKAGMGDQAVKTIEDFLSFNPNNYSAMRLMAYHHLDKGQWKEALPLLLRVRQKIGYNDAILNANIARAYSGVNDHEAAMREAGLAYEIAPANVMVTYVYGQVMLKSGKYPKGAAAMLRKANKLAPNAPEIKRDYEAAKKILAQKKQKK